jgi:signal transduction histidine kinase
MPIFDPRTTVLIAFFLILLFLVILLALFRSFRREIPGLGAGACAALSWSIGAWLIMQRGMIPDSISVGLGNTAFSAGILLMAVALTQVRAGRVRRFPLLIAFAAGYGALRWLLLAELDYRVTLSVTTAFNGICFLLCFRAALKLAPKTFAISLLSVTLGLATLLTTARFVSVIFRVAVPSGLFQDSLVQRLYVGALVISVIATLMGFVLLVYERLHSMLAQSNTSLEAVVSERTRELTTEIEARRELERQAATVAEAERRRIGHELHDDLGQRLTGISLVAEVLSKELDSADSALKQSADAIQHSASDAIAQVRRLAHGLMPVGPEPEAFRAALEQLARSSSVSMVRCSFEYDEPVDVKNEDVATNLFRIALHVRIVVASVDFLINPEGDGE